MYLSCIKKCYNKYKKKHNHISNIFKLALHSEQNIWNTDGSPSTSFKDSLDAIKIDLTTSTINLSDDHYIFNELEFKSYNEKEKKKKKVT